MNRNAIGALIMAALCLSAAPALAADDPQALQSPDTAPAADGVPTHASVILTATVEQEPMRDTPLTRRPGSLSQLYASWIGLQAYDTYSTLAGVGRGGTETNPFVSGLTNNRAMFIAAKASMTLVTVGVAEQMWREHHPGRAVALMIVSNGVMAAVAARNASVLHSLR